MEEKNDNRIPIHVSTISLGPHENRKIVPAHTFKAEGKHSHLVWIIASIIIGVSVPYFVIDVTKNTIAYFSDKKSNTETVAAKNTEDTSRRLGSDDVVEESLAPLLSQSTTTPEQGIYYFKSEDYKLPRTNALSYLAGDVDTGEIIIEKNSSSVFPIASVSKLMTAVVTKENMDPHQSIKVARSSIEAYGTYGGLSAGEKILVTDLLYPLLIESSNDAAEVLADGYGHDVFMKKMNDKAKLIGMKDTFYKDPSGLSHENVSTVSDLFKLGQFIYKNKPELLDITRVRQYAIRNHSWSNGNRLMSKASFIGGKNGFTDSAFQTTLSFFELPLEGGKRRIAIILLKSNDRNGDTDTIIRFLQNSVGFTTNTDLDN